MSVVLWCMLAKSRHRGTACESRAPDQAEIPVVDRLGGHHREIVLKVHEWAPPSVIWDEDIICRESELPV